MTAAVSSEGQPTKAAETTHTTTTAAPTKTPTQAPLSLVFPETKLTRIASDVVVLCWVKHAAGKSFVSWAQSVTKIPAVGGAGAQQLCHCAK